jgi:3-oxoacyl-[acyl-carrier protein] reductase
MVQKPFWEFSVDEWDNMMAINLKGTFLPCKAVFPYMKEQKKGKIINITSTAVFLGIPFITPYTTTKGGIIAFTRELARELGDFNINVNCLSPGLTWTKASQDLIPAEEVTRNTGAMCFKRIEQPDDLPGAVMFLASEDSDFITGQTLVVDGGTFLH